MATDRERYSYLAPLGIDLRVTLALKAVNFFSPQSYKENCQVLNKTINESKIQPLGASDFVKYLEKRGILEESGRYMHRIRQLLERMATAGILMEMGQGTNIMMPKLYYFLKEVTKLQKSGIFWLAPALGEDFIYHLVAPAIVQITGVNKKGDMHSGTGIIFHPNYILTCAHVINDMKVDSHQSFQGVKCSIEHQLAHPTVDVAVIHVDRTLQPVPGLSFLSPVIAQQVFTLGYPKIPFATEAVLTIQRGEVTSESVTTFSGNKNFLYSAIARPGNSGGPIISNDGNIVGIVTQDLTYEDGAFSPHYAGIPCHEIVAAVSKLGIDAQIPVEDFQ